MTPGDQYPSLSHIERELGDIHPVSLPWLDPLELVEITGDYGAVGDCASRTVAAHERSRQEASPPSGWASTIAGALADLRGLAIGMASVFTILWAMRVTL